MEATLLLTELENFNLLRSEKGYLTKGIIAIQFNALADTVRELLATGIARKTVFALLKARHAIAEYFTLPQFYKWLRDNEKIFFNKQEINSFNINTTTTASYANKQCLSHFIDNKKETVSHIETTEQNKKNAFQLYKEKLEKENQNQLEVSEEEKIKKYIKDYQLIQVKGSLFLNAKGDDVYIKTTKAYIDAAHVVPLSWDSSLNPFKNLFTQKPFNKNMYSGCNWLFYDPTDEASPVYFVSGERAYPILKGYAPIASLKNCFEFFDEKVNAKIPYAVSCNTYIDRLTNLDFRDYGYRNIQRINFLEVNSND